MGWVNRRRRGASKVSRRADLVRQYRNKKHRRIIELLEDRRMLTSDIDALVNSLVPRLQTSESQSTAIEIAPNGDTLVVFHGRDLVDDDGIFVRRIAIQEDDSVDFRANTSIVGEQRQPAIAVYPNGDYVVAWSGRGPGDHTGIFARWYDQDDQPLTPETLINQITGGVQQAPDVEVTQDGVTVFVWSGSAGSEEPSGVFRRFFDSNGTPLSDQHRVNVTTTGTQAYPSIAVNDAGRAIVTWSSHDLQENQWQVYHETFFVPPIADTGSFEFEILSEESLVSAHPSSNHQRSRVATDGLGNYVVTWASFENRTSQWNIFSRSFDPLGVPRSDDVLVNQYRSAVNRDPHIAMADDGRYIISWTVGNEDGSGWEVYAQSYAPGGLVAEAQYLVHTAAGVNSGHQEYSAVAIGQGPAQISWSGTGQTDRRGVWIRRTSGAQSPRLQTIAPQIIDEQSLLAIQFTPILGYPEQSVRFDLEPFSHPLGMVIDPTTGRLTWTPSEADGPGEFTAVVEVSDRNDATLRDRLRIRITVREVNRAPELSLPSEITILEGETLQFTASASDHDIPTNTLIYSLVESPSPNITLNPSTGDIRWETTESDGGISGPLTIRVTDNGVPSRSTVATTIVNVTEIESPPIIEPIDIAIIPEEKAWQFRVEATDPDSASTDNLRYSIDSHLADRGISIDSSGVIRWSPTESDGPGVVKGIVFVTDDSGLQSSTQLHIEVVEVNKPPVLAPIDAIATTTNESLEIHANASDYDIPLNDLRFSLDEASVNLGISVEPSTGIIRWTPTTAGIYPVTLTVHDNGTPTLADERTFSIIVDQIYTPPVFDPVTPKSINEQSLLTFQLSAHTTTPERPYQFVLGANQPNNIIVHPETGVVEWTPTESQGPNLHRVRFEVFDVALPSLRSSIDVPITVFEVNEAPQLEGPIERIINEGELLKIQLQAEDRDLPENNLSFRFTPSQQLPAGLSLNPATGLIQWQTRESDGPAIWNLRIEVLDDGTPILSDRTDIRIIIREINQPPSIVSPGNLTIPEMVPWSFPIVVHDSDLPADILTLSLDPASVARGMSIDDSNTLRWTPSEEHGPDIYPVTITVSDNGTPRLQAETTFLITVKEVNRSPVLDAIQDFSIRAGESVFFDASATDPDRPENALIFSIHGDVPIGASIDSRTGSFNWTSPNQSLDGSLHRMTVRVTDDGTPPLYDDTEVTIELLPQTLVLREEDRFVTAYEQRIELQEAVTSLQFQFDWLQFDSSDQNSMNDAFEAALLDDRGIPLAGIVSPGRDAFINLSEEEPALLGSGTTFVWNETRGIVTVDVRHLQPGASVRLIQRLVNNDHDNLSQVTLLPGVIQLTGPGPDSVSTTTPPPFAPIPNQTTSLSDIDWKHLKEVTHQVKFDYTHTAFDVDTDTVAAGLQITNQSNVTLRAPLLLAVTEIDVPEVSVVGYQGSIPRQNALLDSSLSPNLYGAVHYDLSALLEAGALDTGESLGALLQFFNPTTLRFGYQLHLLSHINQPPSFDSTPIASIRLGNTYQEPLEASDPDEDPLQYSLISGPIDLQVDNDTGELTWVPSAEDIGTHAVTVGTSDPYGLSAQQTFSIRVFDSSIRNQPPVFVTDPIIDSYVGTPYEYPALARDPDFDPLVVELLSAPFGMVIDEEFSGPRLLPTPLRWIPQAGDAGQTFPVSLRATDPFGASTTQSFAIRVHANTENLPPQFITQPQTYFTLPDLALPEPYGDVSPNGVQLLLGLDQQTTVPLSITLPEDVVLSTADIVLVVDESGSMEEQAWVAAFIDSMEESLRTRGVGDNRYAIVGFGSFQNAPRIITDKEDYNVLVFGDDGTIVDHQTVRSGIPTQPIAFPQSGKYSLAITRYEPTNGEPPEASVPPLAPLNFQFTADQNTPLSNPRIGWGEHTGTLTDGMVSIPFQSSAGELLLIDGIVGESINAELVDPNDRTVVSLSSLTDDSEPMILRESGTYQLRLQGILGTPFRLSLLHPIEDATPINVGVPTEGVLDDPDSWQFFSFDTIDSTPWVIDRLAPDSDTAFGSPSSGQFDLYIFGPNGLIASSQIESEPLGAPPESLPYDFAPLPLIDGETYSVGVRRSALSENAIAPIPFKFQVADLELIGSTEIVGTSISSSLPYPTGTQVHQIDIEQPMILDFNVISETNPNGKWQWIDPDGYPVTEGTLEFGTRFSDLPIRVPGTYSLVVQGNYDNISAVDYEWKLTQKSGEPSLPNGPQFATDSVLTAELSAGEITSHFFQLNEGEIAFPSLIHPSQSAVWWQLRGPTGGLLYSTFRDTNIDSGFEAGDSSETYRPMIQASRTGLYELQLLSPNTDAEAVFHVQVETESLVVDSLVTGQLRPSGSVAVYSLDAVQGETLVLSSTQEHELFARAEDAFQRASSLRANGDIEDGYWGISHALQYLPLRPNASQHVILITDEDRDNVQLSLTRELIATNFQGENPTLHVISNSRLFSGDPDGNQHALGVLSDSDSNSPPLQFFYSAPDGTYREVFADELIAVDSHGTTLDDYIELALSTHGTAWDIQRLRNSGSTEIDERASLTRAFVSTLTDTIAREAVVGLQFSPSDAPVSIEIPQIVDRTVTFPVHFTGDGSAWNILFEFVDVNSPDILYGTLPAALSTAYQYDFLAIDPENDPITYRLNSGDYPGVEFHETQQRLYFSPTSPGIYTFDMSAQDRWGGTDQQIWEVIVEEQSSENQPPGFEDIAIPQIEVGRSLQTTFIANDPDGDAITYRLTPSGSSTGTNLPPAGSTIVPTSGLFTWTPERHQIGFHELTIYASDGRGGNAVYSWGVDVVPPRTHQNQPPVFLNSLSTLAIAGSTFRHQVEAFDEDLDPIEYALAWGPENMQIDNKRGTLVWKPAASEIGAHPVIIRITDGQGGVRLQEVSLTVVEGNIPPVFTSTPPAFATLGKWWVYQPELHDPNGDIPQVRLAKPWIDDGISVDPQTGLLSWLPDSHGVHHIEIEAVDHRGGVTKQIFSVEVNPSSPPIASPLEKSIMILGQANTLEFQSYDFDEDDLHTASLPPWAEHLGISITSTLGSTDDTYLISESLHTVTWSPSRTGTFLIPLTMRDQSGETVVIDWSVEVVLPRSTSKPPVFTTMPKGPAYPGAAWSYKPLATDPDGRRVAITLDSPQREDVSWNDDEGVLTWSSPTLGRPLEINLKATDSSGVSTYQRFVLNPETRPSNQHPQWLSVPITQTSAEATWIYPASAIDPSGTQVTLSIAPETAELGVRLNPITQTITWTPNHEGSYQIELVAQNAFGESTVQVFELQVLPRFNTNPRIRSIPTGPAILGEPWSHQIQAFDSDGDSLHYSITTNGLPSDIQIDRVTGRLIFLPTTLGSYEYTLSVRDDHGGEAQQSFSLDVVEQSTPGNTNPPVFTSVPTGPAYVDVPWRYHIRTSLSNGGHVSLSLDAPSIERGATLDDEGVLEWMPNQSGSFDFIVTARGPSGRERIQTFRLDVSHKNRSPEFESHPDTQPIIGRLWEYPIQLTDPDGETPSLSLNAEAVASGLVLGDDLTLRWTPTDTQGVPVELTAMDSRGAVSIQRFYLSPAAMLPNGNKVLFRGISLLEIPSGMPFDFSVEAFTPASSLPDAPSIDYALVDAPQGMRIDPQSGKTQWTPESIGDFSFTVIANNAHGATRTHTSTVKVIPNRDANRSPLFESVPLFPAVLDLPYRYPIDLRDPDGDITEISLDSVSIEKGLRITEVGSLEWTPTEPGNHRVTITAIDPWGSSTTQQFDLIVLENAPPQIHSYPDRHLLEVGTPFTYQIIAKDPNSIDAMEYSVTESQPGVIIDSQTGVFQWTPDSLGSQEFLFTVTDGRGSATTQSWTFSVIDPSVNHPPEIIGSPRTKLASTIPFTYEILAIDPDQEPIHYSLVSGPQGIVVDRAGVLTWTPNESQITREEPHTVIVQARDARGLSHEATWQFRVGSTLDNEPPVIAGNPTTSAVVGRVYQSTFTAVDVDGDLIEWQVLPNDSNARIDDHGLFVWIPEDHHIGTHQWTIIARDPWGSSDQFTFEIDVRGGNSPARISGTPPNLHRRGDSYRTQFHAIDPDNDLIRFSFAQGTPTHGAEIDETTGELSWLPQEDGTFDFIVVATDSFNEGTALRFTVTVDAWGPNEPPVFDDTQPRIADGGMLYEQTFSAIDPEGLSVLYEVVDGPEGLSIDAEGNVRWLVPTSLIGTDVLITLRASDPAGLNGHYYARIPVRAPNRPPVISSTPTTQSTWGGIYEYIITIVDPDADQVAIHLVTAPDGAILDSETNQIYWRTQSADVSQYSFEIEATDGRISTPISQTWTVDVTADITPPTVNIEHDEGPFEIGDSIVVTLRTDDDTQVVERNLFLDGTGITLDANGNAILRLDRAGLISLEGVAKDPSENIGRYQSSIRVRDPNNAAPEIHITIPENKQRITVPTEIRGSITDPENRLVRTEITIRAVGPTNKAILLDQRTADDEGFIENRSNQALAIIDPTLLPNGPYMLEIVVEDSSGNLSRESIELEVAGLLKLGSYSTAFDDLNIPIAGIPISIRRNYDSLRADTFGDFGYGWNLDINQIQVRFEDGVVGGAGQGRYAAFQDETRVQVLLPEGLSIPFEFHPTEDSTSGSGAPTFIPHFEPVGGSVYQLIAPMKILRRIQGEYHTVDGIPYHPADPEIGNFLILVTPDGLRYRINPSSFKTESITDRNGNQVVVTDNEITSNRGTSISIQRDHRNRISKIIDPRGNQITYAYDSLDRLIAITDRLQNTLPEEQQKPLRLTYHPENLYLLHQTIAGDGTVLASSEVDTQGRMDTMRGPTEMVIRSTFDVASLSQSLTIGSEIDVQQSFDSSGNLTRFADSSTAATELTYSSSGKPTSITRVLYDEETGEVAETFEYTLELDDDGRVLARTSPDGNRTRYILDPETGLVQGEIDSLGNQTSYGYDERGNLTSITNPNQQETRYVFDEYGNITRASIVDLSPGSQGECDDDPLAFNRCFAETLAFEAAYDAQGNQIEKTNHLGLTLKKSYDANHQLIQTRTIDQSSNNTLVVQAATQYDPNDQPISSTSAMIDPSGETSSPRQTEREFNLLGQVTRESTIAGVVTSTAFSSSGLPSSTASTSPDGTTHVSYQIYDAMGRISIQTDPVPLDQQPTSGKRYNYDKVGQIIQTEALIGLSIDIQKTGERIDVELIDEGQVLQGAVASPDAINHPVEIATNDGRSTERIRDYLGRTIQTVVTVRGSDGNPDVRIQKTAYDAYGRVETATDPFLDNVGAPITGVRYVYAPNGETLRIDRVSNLVISIHQRSDGTWESVVESPGEFIDNDLTQYDEAGRTKSIQQPEGTRVDFIYDGMGRTVVRREIPNENTTASPRVSLTVYESTNDDPFVSVVTSDQVTFAQQEYLGIQATRTLSDLQGRVVRTELLSNVSFAFESLPGGRGEVTITDPGEIVAVSATSYDSLGRIIAQQAFSGGLTEYVYDESGNLERLTGPEYFDIELNDTVRPRTEYQYSGSRRIAKTDGIRVFTNGTVDLSAAGTTRFVYDTSGRLVKTILANGQSATSEFDLLGRLLSERNAAGQETRYLYDSSGNLKSILLPLTEDPNLGLYHPRTDFEHDDWGNRISTTTGIVHYPDGTIDHTWARETKETYDATGRLVSTERPEGIIEQRTYTEQGLIDHIVRPDGSIEAYDWSEDTLNPGLLRTEYFASMSSYELGIAHDYTDASTDTFGNVQTHFSSGSIFKTVNDQGQIAAIQSPSGTLHYQYDRLGRLTTVSSMDSETASEPRTVIQYNYDSSDRIFSVSQTVDRGNPLEVPITYHYSYDVFGRVARILHPDDTIEVHHYDLLGRKTSVEYFAGDSTPETTSDNPRLASFQSSFDTSGHRAYLNETTWDGVTQSIVMQREIFLDHDATGRLVRYRVVSDLEDSTIQYAYDPAHNRISEKNDLGSDGVFEAETIWNYDLADRILSESEIIDGVPTTTTSFEYQAGGTSPINKTTRRVEDSAILSSTDYEYDLRGYLLAVDTVYGASQETRERTEWVRTPVGAALQKRDQRWDGESLVSDQAIDILVDEQSLTGYSQWFETRDSENDATLMNVIAGHRVLAEITSTEQRDLWTDPMHSVRIVRNLASGNQESMEYDPYGVPVTEVASLHGYSGEVYSESTGQIELRQRTYDPSLGRFLQPDRFSGMSQVPTSLHRYSYASNAPYTFRDPSGNVFVLIDGTWNHDSAAHLEEGEAFTNIVALRDAYETANQGIRAAYRRGVGNPVDNGPINSGLGGGFGKGLTKIVEDAVTFSLHRVMDGEPIYVTGFSRGAIASLQYAHEIQKIAPAARIRFMAIYDPVASLGFPGNGLNFGFNTSLASNVDKAATLISWQEDRGFFPGTNLHTSRVRQRAVFGVHSDVGGGYALPPTEMIQDSLHYFYRQFLDVGLKLDKAGIECNYCNGIHAHYPHSDKTYLTQGGKVLSGLFRPMIEHPMPGELGLAFFAEEIDLTRVGKSSVEALFVMYMWIPLEVINIYAGNLILQQYSGPVATMHLAWNFGKLHNSHLQYWLNRA